MLECGLFILDNNPIASTWGGLLTWNGVTASQDIATGIAACMAQGIDYDTCYNMIMADPTIQNLLSTDDSNLQVNKVHIA